MQGLSNMSERRVATPRSRTVQPTVHTEGRAEGTCYSRYKLQSLYYVAWKYPRDMINDVYFFFF